MQNRDRDIDDEFSREMLDAAAEVIRRRHSGPTSDVDIPQWNRETFQLALKAAYGRNDNDV